ncbi:hypothetical protein [Brevibacillus sp. Leaf182]|uniref:hypothetical protein n=1 Tax=Brevibacillus sp. Leaf182 TaxID=1736290 RepID=UPI000AB49BE9|nr:hypothetical protein [Brevibacillus sp. Leaf182]
MSTKLDGNWSGMLHKIGYYPILNGSIAAHNMEKDYRSSRGTKWVNYYLNVVG